MASQDIEQIEAKAAHAARQAARQAVIDRYGSEEAARAPTDRERAILSGKPWPMPTTYAAAVAEQAEWTARDEELADLKAADPRPYPIRSLPGKLQNRADAVTDLVESGIPLRTLAEIADRMRRFADREAAVLAAEARFALSNIARPSVALSGLDQERSLILAAVMRDIGALADREASTSVQRVKVAGILRDDPSASDRHIARRIGCSPTTVGKVRLDLGLRVEHRTVRRGGQMYEITPKRRTET